jgi:hypothetical protein
VLFGCLSRDNCCGVFILLKYFFCHSIDALYAAFLDLYANSLTGTFPTEIASLTSLCESSIGWLLVVMIVLMFQQYSNAHDGIVLHSTDDLALYDSNLTGEFMCPAFVDICAISCNYNSYSNSIIDEDC